MRAQFSLSGQGRSGWALLACGPARRQQRAAGSGLDAASKGFMGSRQLSVHSTQFFCSYGQQAVERYAVFLLLREAGSGALPRAPLLCLLLDHMGLCLDLGLFCFRI